MRKQTLNKVLFSLVGLACLGLFALFGKPASVSATSPSTVNFQGKVTNHDGTNVADGSYTFVFRLYNSSSPTIGGSCTTGGCLWEETDTVSTTNGVFQVELGANCSFFSAVSCNNSTPIDFTSNSLYLTMKFNGDSAGFMTPLVHFTGIPYAYQAGNSAALGGLAATNFVQLAQGLQTDGSSSNASIAINKTAGTAGLLDLQRGGVDITTISNTGQVLFKPYTGSDSTTAFQIQNAASTDVLTVDTANTELKLRASNPVTLGSELFTSITNCSGSNWTVGGGNATHATGNYDTLDCSAPAVTAGDTYLISFTVSGDSNPGDPNAGVYPFIGDKYSNLTILDNGNYQTYVTSDDTNDFGMDGDEDFDGSISNISIKQVTAIADNPIISIANYDNSPALQVRTGIPLLENLFVGNSAGQSISSGDNNFGIGNFALQTNTTGSKNVAIGNNSLSSNTTGDQNVAIGLNSLLSNTTGSENIAIGTSALRANTTGNSNLGIGNFSLSENTIGTDNIALGNGTLTSNTTGSFNTGIGQSSLSSNTTGQGNTGVGTGALGGNQTGSENAAFGVGALGNSTGVDNNSAFGAFALNNNLSGTQNTAVGHQSLSGNTTGINNTSVGASSLLTINGSYNSTLGSYAGRDITFGSNNTFIGAQSGYIDPNISTFVTTTYNLQNATAIGYGSQVQENNALILGGQGANAVSVGIGTTSPTNLFSISPDVYDSGGASVTAGLTAVTGTGTAWTADMAGMELIFGDGTKYIIQSVTDGTDLTLSTAASQNESSTNYRIHNPAFFVSSTGQTGVRTSTNSTTAFQVQDAAGNGFLTADSTNAQLVLGASTTTNGTLVFANSAGSNTVGFSLQADPASSYTLLLPTTGPAVSQCLQTDGTTANQLVFGSCAGGSTPTLQQVYDASTSQPQITLDSSPGASGIIIQDASSPVTGSLFTLQDNGGSTKYFDVSASTGIASTYTNSSSSGGTFNYLNQAITVSNTSSASTTNGVNIALNDNASSIANVDTGLKIALAGSNSSQKQVGIDTTVTAGFGLKVTSSGASGSAILCGNTSFSELAICAYGNSAGSLGIFGQTTGTGSLNSYAGTGVVGSNTTNTTGSQVVAGVRGFTTGAGTSGTSIGVYGDAEAGAGATAYGGYFTLQGSTATAGAALFATNYTVASNILDLQDNTTSVFTVGDQGLISLQPAAALTGTGTQSNVSQTLTNNQTGGTVNGYKQAITVSNASGSATTNGFNIGLTDNTTLANSNQGINISLTGSNTNRLDIGVTSSVSVGGALVGVSSGGSGNIGVPCGNLSYSASVGVCGASTATGNTSSATGVGILGVAQSSTTVSFNNGAGGSGVEGLNEASGSASQFYKGVAAISSQSSAAAYTSTGIYANATGGAGATVYGGYFSLQGSSATSGASLFATNSSVAANILELQDNTSDVLSVADGGALTITPVGNNIGTIVRQTSGTATSGSVFDVQGANGTSHFIQVTQTAANQGAVSVSSLGSNDLTLDSGSGTLKLGSTTTTLQKAASAFTLDLTNAGASTLTVSNSNGANVANLSVSGDIAAGSGHVFKVGATSGSTISACSSNNYISSFASTGGLVTGGSCSTIATTNLSDGSNIALLNAANTFAPTANNVGNTFKQTSGTATSGNIFDIQGANGTSHFLQVTETAANAGSISLTSLGSNNLTLDSGSGNLILGSNTTTVQKSATALTLDVTNSSDSTLTITNSGAGVASLSVEGDIAAGSGRVFKVGATSGTTISACAANNYVGSFASTGGIVTGGSCGTIASTNLSDTANIARLNASNTFAPTANNVGTVIKQTSGTATSGDIFDVQGANGTTHFIQVIESAANAAAVSIASVGSNDLTLDSGSGTIKIGSNATTLQKTASAFTVDLNNAGTSTLTISNSNGANVANLSVSGSITSGSDIIAGTGHVFKVGATSGSTISACSSNNYISSFASAGGIVTGGSCSTIASTNLSDSSNIALLNAANTFAPTANNVGNTFKQTSGTATSGNVFDIQTTNGTSHFLTIANSAANEGAVTLQSIGATRSLTLDSGSGTVIFGSNTTTLQKSGTAFTLDVTNSSDSTITVTNSGTGVASLSVEGDIAAGTGRVFKVGATSGSSISACSSNNYISLFASTGGLVTGGSCSTIASSNLSDSSNIALLNAANTFAPTANNVGNTFKQTSGTATSGNIFDIQTANGTSHILQATNAAANESAVTLQSIGATRDLTLDSGSGTLKLGSNTTTLQKAASAFTLDLTNAGASTLTVSNSNGANVANLSVSGDIAAGSGHVFKVGATSGSTISACSSNNYISSFASTGGLVTGGSCSTIATTNLSDGSNIALLNAANTFAPTANNVGNTFKQTSGTATSGNIFDIQGANGTSHFLQVTETAANQGSISLTSLGSNDLTLDSGSGTLKLGSTTTTLQKSASAFTLDLTNAGTSTLTVSNSNGANVANLGVSGSITAGTDIVAGSGHVFKVGATSGTTISACSGGQYVASFASAGGIVTGGSCTALPGGSGDNGFVNSVAVTDFNLQDVSSSSSVTGTAWTGTGSSPTNITLAVSNADALNAGSITAGTQTIGGNKTFNGQEIITPTFGSGSTGTGLTITTPGDSNIHNASDVGIKIGTGSGITQNTAAANGNYVSVQILQPTLTLTTGTSLTSAGISVSTGAQTQSAGNLTQYGIAVGIDGNVNSGTFNGLGIFAPSAVTFTAGSTITGANVDLNTTVAANGVTETGLSVATSADTNIANVVKTGLTITSGSITEGTISDTGTYYGINLTVPSLTTTASTGNLNGYGLYLATGSLTHGASTSLTENGIYVDSGSTTLSAGATLNGVNVNIGTIAAGSNYTGLNVSTNGSGRIFSAGASITGINVDLNNNGNNTATGTSETGLSIATSADSAIAAATKTGLSITSGSITETTAFTGTYVGADITVGNLISNSSATALNAYGLRVTTHSLTQSAGTLTENGLTVDSSSTTITTGGTLNGLNIAGGSITGSNTATGTANDITLTTAALALTTATTQTINGINLGTAGALNNTGTAGTINNAGISLVTPNVTTGVSGTTILSDGLKITQGSYTVTNNNGANGGVNGIDIAGGAISPATGKTGTINNINLTTAALALTTTGTANINGINLGTAGAISTGTAAGTINYNGLNITTPGATLNVASSNITSNGGVFNIGAAVLTTGTSLTTNGLDVATGNITQSSGSAGALTENGIFVNASSTAFTTGGTLNGIKISNVTNTNATATNALTIGDGWGTGVTLGNTTTGINISGTSTTAVTINGTSTTGLSISNATTGISVTNGATTTGLSISASSLTTGALASLSATINPSSGGTTTPVSLSFTNSPTSVADILKGITLSLSDSTALANALTALNIDLSGVSNVAATKTAIAATGGSIIQTPVNPTYTGGVESLNTAGSSKTVNSVFVSGNYEYTAVTSDGSASACSSGNHCEIQILDISNPSSPAFVSGIDSSTTGTGTNTPEAVFVAGHYLYVGLIGTAGTCSASVSTGCELQVYDISDPASPVYVGGFDEGSSEAVLSVYVSGRYAYIGKNADSGTCSSASSAGCELQIFDISNPTSPTYVGGAESQNTSATNTDVKSVFVQGKYAYLAVASNASISACSSGTNCEFEIYNISNPSSPSFVGGADSTNAGTGTVSSISVYVSGRYAYLDSAGNSGTCSSSTRDGCELKIFDISNPASPAYTGGADNGVGTADANDSVYVAGKYAYVVKTGDGGTCSNSVATGCEFQIYDVSNPSSPAYKGGSESSVGTTTDSISSVYVSGRYAYVGKAGNAGTCNSSVSTGCEAQIYDLTGVDATTLTGGSIYAGTLAVGSNGQVAGDFNIQGGASVGQALNVGGSIATGSGVSIASTGNTGSITLTQQSTSSSFTLQLPSALPGASGYCIVSTNLGVLSFSACGAGSTATQTLTPEFAGAVMTGDGTNNTGTMTSDFCSNSVGSLPALTTGCNSGETHNFYQWTANATNDYEVFVKWQTPSDFSSFNAVTFNGFRTSSSDAVTVTIYNAAGTSCGSASIAGTVNTWNDNTSITTSCTPSPGDILTIDVHLSVGVNAEFARMGEMKITYNRN